MQKNDYFQMKIKSFLFESCHVFASLVHRHGYGGGGTGCTRGPWPPLFNIIHFDPHFLPLKNTQMIQKSMSVRQWTDSAVHAGPQPGRPTLEQLLGIAAETCYC